MRFAQHSMQAESGEAGFAERVPMFCASSSRQTSKVHASSGEDALQTCQRCVQHVQYALTFVTAKLRSADPLNQLLKTRPNMVRQWLS